MTVMYYLYSLVIRDRPLFGLNLLFRADSVSAKRAVVTAALCAVAGAAATIPFYTAFWWWDLLAHALGSGAIAATLSLLIRSYGGIMSGVLFIGIGWEVVEKTVPTAPLPIAFITDDAPSDILANLVGGVATILVLHLLG
jgi:hypothetical protein